MEQPKEKAKGAPLVFFGRLRPEEGEAAFTAFCDLGIAVTTKPNLHLMAWELARKHNRPRGYDSCYLAAAQAESCELWSGWESVTTLEDYVRR